MQAVGMKTCRIYLLLETYFTQEPGNIWELEGEQYTKQSSVWCLSVLVWKDGLRKAGVSPEMEKM